VDEIDQVIIKLPCTQQGICACSSLDQRHDIRCNLTLCCSVPQAILAAAAGAWCVSPFVARCEDIGITDLVANIRKVFDRGGIKTKILCGSLRSPRQVVDSFLAGADICTVSPELLERMFDHPLTESGLQKFMADWEAVQA